MIRYLKLAGFGMLLWAILVAAGCTRSPDQAGYLPLKQILEYSVQDDQGNILGSVDYLLLDEQSEQIDFLVLKVEDAIIMGKSSFLGSSDRWIPIPWEQIRLDRGGRRLILAMDPSLLAEAPWFPERPDLDRPEQEAAVRTYWSRQK